MSYIAFNTSYLYIPGTNLNSEYNEEKSSSYIKRKKDVVTFYHEPIINGYLSNETFHFENYFNKKILFHQIKNNKIIKFKKNFYTFKLIYIFKTQI